MTVQRDRRSTEFVDRLTGDISRRELMRRAAGLGAAAVVGGSLATAGVSAVSAAPRTQTGDRKVRKLQLLTNPQANVPEEFEAAQVAAKQLKEIGITLDVQVADNTQLQDHVWFQRDKWDMTMWQMVGRPERLDPDEFVYNLFHSTTAEDGYNFVGYLNPEYDKLAEAQRVEMDREKRKALIAQAQQIIANDQPFIFSVYPHANYAYNKTIWDESTIVESKGIGIKAYWTFVGATPLSDQKDMVLNTLVAVQAINPLYISGGVDSWVTELIWDRLMRIDASGLPQPYAAEKVEWTDERTVVCTLRAGMTWHDGQPVTVDDVIFSFQAPAGDMSPMYKPFVAPIESVTAVGDNQVQFTLKAPTAAFETSGLAKLNLIPKHIWEPILTDMQAQGQNAQDHQEETPIGSGPFKFVNWARQQEIVLEANTSHFQAPKMGRWILRDMPNVSAALGALQSGEINFLSDYTGDPQLLEQAVQSTEGLAIVSTIPVGFRFYAPNERRPPLDDAALRRAMATAIGKEQIVQNIYKGFATVADSHVSKALEFWHADGLPDYAKADIEGAKKILQDAGYSWDDDGNLLYPEGKSETLETGTL
ncbi:MAG: peptide/nickel transport system substrate-binding protein [Thermomicrobiales bacterium]|jgi:peptide/nickel transport system substrate-binding protein|nr:peptide/nickel transport system substrate-binding protein [Thermomicrobiales bacterium]